MNSKFRIKVALRRQKRREALGEPKNRPIAAAPMQFGIAMSRNPDHPNHCMRITGRYRPMHHVHDVAAYSAQPMDRMACGMCVGSDGQFSTLAGAAAASTSYDCLGCTVERHLTTTHSWVVIAAFMQNLPHVECQVDVELGAVFLG